MDKSKFAVLFEFVCRFLWKLFFSNGEEVK